ncbi:hypothetical protein J6590_069495 [Homalodisca vitripennis]|nr:hypothetical protein J6590_069495 [Homalodisca vitripennis]
MKAKIKGGAKVLSGLRVEILVFFPLTKNSPSTQSRYAFGLVQKNWRIALMFLMSKRYKEFIWASSSTTFLELFRRARLLIPGDKSVTATDSRRCT